MANGPIDTFSLVVRSDWASKVGRWQVATEYRVVDTFGVGVKKGPLREMLEQTTGVREIYLQNFALVVGEVAPEDRGIDRVIGASNRDHGNQPPAEFFLKSLAGLLFWASVERARFQTSILDPVVMTALNGDRSLP
ncbi:hypothetical protein D3C78_1312010 [compost metagenome]